MSRGPHPQLALDHDALAHDLLAGYSMLVEQGHSESPHEDLERFCLHLGYHLEHICKRQLGVERFTREQFAEVAAELVRAFGGECEVVASGSTPIVLQAREWLAPDAAQGGPHPSLLVQEILAEVAARNFGYGKVNLQQSDGGGYALRVYLKESRHARMDDGVERTPESLPDPGELEHELLHQMERVRALRDALRHTEQRFAALVSQAPDGILSLDLEGRCTYANEAATQLLGYRRGELSGQRLAELVPQESGALVAEEFARACGGQATDLYRMTVVTRPGEQRRLSIRMWPRRNQGRVVGVEALARDVTDREAREKALGRSEALYRTLVEMSPESIFMLDAEGKITFVNPRGTQATGYAEWELVGSHFAKVLAPENQATGRAAFQRAMAPDAEPALLQLNMATKGGQPMSTEITIAQIREGDEIVGLLGVGRDVTRRREIEAELFEQHRALSALHAIANAVSRSLDLQATLEDALEKVLAVTEFEGGAIFLLDAEANTLRLGPVRGLPESQVATMRELPVGEAVSGHVVVSGEPLVLDDPAAYGGPNQEAVQRLGLQTLVVVPLVAQQGVMGTMCLGARAKLKVSPELLDLLVGIGSQVGMGIQNARLFEQTQQQARTDGLTGLYNRQYLQELFEREAGRARRYGHSMAVLMLDLDGLKAINDAQGHRMGDEALRALGEVLRGSVRGCDIAARYGGDEFVIVMPETDAEGAEAAAERLNESLAAFNETGRLPLRLSVSIGVAATGADFEGLLDEADRAMYASRERRRRRRAPGEPAAAARQP